MSGLAGIFKFDPRDSITRPELMRLAKGIDRIGPDGGAEYLRQNLGMAYRAFHTTTESHSEIQPVVRDGFILTWDGRLDNREEIRARIRRQFDGTPTDAELVLGAYQELGTSSLRELIGDWALALWDPAERRLVLARDYIGVRRLFFRVDENGIAWCTAVEPLVQTASRKLHLDLDFLAGCLYPRPPVETTPYREIRSVVPAGFVTVRYGGQLTSEQYWWLNPQAQIRYSNDCEYEEHFVNEFRTAVSRRLRSDRTMLAELSGGVDSSSVVCMADAIRRGEPGTAIETLSYYDSDAPGGDERPYFTRVEQQRGHTGHHISVSEFNQVTAPQALSPLPNEYFTGSPGYSAKSLSWDTLIDAIQRQSGARVILSGIGGDEFLGGVQYEAPELADHLLKGALLPFLKSTLQWGLARKKTVFALIAESFNLIRASYSPLRLLAPPGSPFPWARLKPPTCHVAFPDFARWRQLSPALLCMESTRYSLAQQLTGADPPLVGCSELRYPFLDRSLYVFLASIPRTQILRANGRRHLQRRALRDIVPDEVLSRKTKSFGFRSALAVLSSQPEVTANLFGADWLSDNVVVDAATLRESLAHLEHDGATAGRALITALEIEQWLCSQVRLGIFDWTPPSAVCRVQSDSVSELS